MASAENKSVKRIVDKTTLSTRIGGTDKSNPFFNWSAEIIEVFPNEDSNVAPQKLRRRNIERMHKFEQKKDTVASIKIIKESVSIGGEGNKFQDVNDNFRTRNDVIRGGGGLFGTDVLFETTNFVLQAMGETDSEKFQVLDNFGELPQIFMFGRRPRIYTYSGMLWNHSENNWKDEFKYTYKTYLRGTKCVEYGVKVLLTFDRSVRMGYILNANINQNAETEMAVPFSFSMFIEDEKELIDVDSIDPSSTNNTESSVESAFYLVGLQKKAVTAKANERQTAIDKKLKINKNKDKDIVPNTDKVIPKSEETPNLFEDELLDLNPQLNLQTPEEFDAQTKRYKEAENNNIVNSFYQDIRDTSVSTIPTGNPAQRRNKGGATGEW